MRGVKITGGEWADIIFELDQPWCGGPIMWNVTRARYDAVHGRFGVPRIDRWETPPNFDNLDRKKIAMFRKMPEVLDAPGIVVEVLQGDVEYRVFIDGNHRATARMLNKTNDLIYWLIPYWMEQNYRVTMELTEE